MPRRKRRAVTSAPQTALDQLAMMPYLQRFLDASAALGLSTQTVGLRERSLKSFLHWCEERGLARPQDVTRPVLERYRRHLFHYRKRNGAPLSYATQAQRLMPIKAFFKWLAKENYILHNPASELTLPRVHRRLPRQLLTAQEVDQVLAQTALHGAAGVRDRAIIETFYSTGIRRQELINLTLYDVEPQQGTLMVREGKGRKDRLLPIGERACEWVMRYLETVRPGLALRTSDDTLFLDDDGERFRGSQLGDRVRKYIVAAGIDKPGSCHVFRHSMATGMLDNGADIRFIQAMLGHADLNTTQLYTQVSIAKLKAVHAMTHPVSRPAVHADALDGSGDDNDSETR